jgi:hypothetical protein
MTAIDANDNVFVVGYSVVGDRVTTRKYGPGGAILWGRLTRLRRARPGFVACRGPAANAVVSGYLIAGTFNPAGSVVNKYDGAGSLLWKEP